jgi:His-Xaa-Ser system radical SAM maturase HxsC
MKILKGKAQRIPRVIIARVETSNIDARGISHLLVTCDSTIPHILLRSGFPTQGVYVHPSVYLDVPIRFDDGDILRITPDGECLRIYESSSDENILLITEGCNNKCLMCPQPPKKNYPSLKSEIYELLNLIETSPNTLGISGGEPTLAFDDLIFAAEVLKNKHPTTYIQLLTNARILSDYKKVKSICNILGNRINFCVPLYADCSEIHDEMVQFSGAFDDTMEGLANLARLKANIEIRNVITKINVNRLPDWSYFIYRNISSISHVAIMELEAIGYARKNIEQLWISPLDYAEELITAIRQLRRQCLDVSIYNHPLCLIPKKVRKFSVKSISPWKVRFVSACEKCIEKASCGGLFFSSVNLENSDITPITMIG